MKVAPVISAALHWNQEQRCSVPVEPVLIHTGQHYDELLSEVFFRQLDLPEPDEYLGVGSGSQARQTARLMEALEPVILRHRPEAVLVPGDVNSTLAGALVAAKLNIPVIHLEAGLRSGDRTMPEEVNRVVVDHVAGLLLTTCDDGDENLLREGLPPERIVRVGNTMIDSLVRLRGESRSLVAATRHQLGLGDRPYVLVTIHRPSNADEPEQLSRLMDLLSTVASVATVVFPVHPRTRARLADTESRARSLPASVLLIEPLGYLEFLGLMENAAAVITDSGGVQEETTFLGVPCVTVRTTTERPVTLTLGTNALVDPSDLPAMVTAVHDAIARGPSRPAPVVPLWDGLSGQRVIEALATWAATGDICRGATSHEDRPPAHPVR
jgi:UDP-N-acetylglucosamine 2-epimerase (non-hydrolysing)